MPIEHLAAVDMVAGASQQVIGGLERLAVLSGAVRHRRPPRPVHHVGRHPTGEGGEQRLLFVASGMPEGGKLRSLPIAHGAGELAAEQVLVGPVEVVEHAERPAHLRIGEFFQAGVEHEPGDHRRDAERKILDDDLALLGGGKIEVALGLQGAHAGVGRAGIGRANALLEGLELRVGVEEILDGDRVVIVEAALGRDVFAPIVGIALENDAVAGFDLGHRVGARADERFQRRAIKSLLVERMLRHDRRHRDDERKFPVRQVVEGELDAVVAGLLQLGDLLHAIRIGRAALVGEDIVGEQHVVGRDRLAVRPFRFRIEMELDRLAVVAHIGRVGEQAVEREGLVHVALHQRLEDQIAEDRVDHAACRGTQAFQDERVEVVERPDHAIGDRAALGRLRVGIVEMGVVRRQRRLALHGDGIARPGCRRREGRNHKSGGQPGKKTVHGRFPAGRLHDSAGKVA